MPNCNSVQCYGAELGSYQDPTIPKASYFYIGFGLCQEEAEFKVSAETADIIV
jgi:hypothetical protein